MWHGKTPFMKKLRADLTQEMLAIILCKIFLCFTLLSKSINITIYIIKNLPVVFMGVKFGLSHWGRDTSWRCLSIECWERYFGLRGTRWQGSRVDFVKRSFVINTAHQVFVWSDQEEWGGQVMWHMRGRKSAYGRLVGKSGIDTTWKN
jgi:hypothetical protein